MINQRLRKSVIVTLKSGVAFRGVLFDHDRDAFVMRNVEHLHPGADHPTPVDGEIVLLVVDVLHMQFV